MQGVQAPAGPVHLRRANPSDARGIATVHVRSWQEAYRGLVPQHVLDALSIDAREELWRSAVTDVGPERRPWIAESEHGAVGFVSGGASRDPDAAASTGEVYALYVCPGSWRMGIGRLLLEHACRDLRAHGFLEATLWVLEEELGARAFYEALGWAPDGGRRTETMADTELPVVRYRKAL